MFFKLIYLKILEKYLASMWKDLWWFVKLVSRLSSFVTLVSKLSSFVKLVSRLSSFAKLVSRLSSFVKLKLLQNWLQITFRSSHQRCSVKKTLLEISQDSQENTCAIVSLLKKKLWHRCFPVNFAKFLRTPFLQNISGRLLLHFQEKLHIDIADHNYTEFIGPLVILIEAPVTLLVCTSGTTKLFLSKGMSKKIWKILSLKMFTIQ